MRKSDPIFRAAAVAVLVALLAPSLLAESPYAGWTNGPPTDPNFFPIGVWLQDTRPSRVAQYQAAGFNLYVGLWRGPTETQLSNLKSMGMKCVCSQNYTGLNSPNRDVIVAWSQQDEPDNAQWNAATQTYDPPITPTEIVSRYNAMKAGDSTRPVFLNFGMGVAWDGWWGRGTRTYHPEDYPLYCEGTDVASFDVYPFAANTDPRYKPIKDRPWMIPYGVDRLVQWTAQASPDPQIVWNFVECTNIHYYGKATPTQVKAEVWMSIIHGSMGILYFVHQFRVEADDGTVLQPFIEAALLADAEMTAAVTAINQQIHSLAPVLNSPTVPGGATVESSDPNVPVDILVKQYGDDVYLFAVGMRDGPTTAVYQLAGPLATGTAEVIGEDRTIAVTDGSFQDTFTPYAAHLYRIPVAGPRVSGWEVVARHGAAGDVAAPAADGYVEPRIGGFQAVRVAFDRPLKAATLTPGAVTLAGQAAGDLSSLVEALSLDASGKVLTIGLSSALPDADTFTVTVTDQVTDTDDFSAVGDCDLVASTLAGDADGSGQVTAADILAVRVRGSGAIGAANARYDVSASGAVTGADLLAVRERLGRALP